jgi:transposase
MRVSTTRLSNRYSDDFRSDALNLIRRGDRSFRRLGEDLGVSPWTLRTWWKNDQMAQKKKSKSAPQSSDPSSTDTAEQQLATLKRENERLRKENDALRMDREILKKAAAFFAKESE